jgi:hypothetical protein
MAPEVCLLSANRANPANLSMRHAQVGFQFSNNITQQKTGIRRRMERYCARSGQNELPGSLPAGCVAPVGLRWWRRMPSTNAMEGSVPRLTDAQLYILSTASLRDDHAAEGMTNLSNEVAQKAVKELIRLGMLVEVRATGSVPVWRSGKHSGPIGLRITDEGLKAIGATDELPLSQPRTRP